jgi:hypothetical protein
MDAPDPLLEAEPDFQAEQFLQARVELTALNASADMITNILRQAWIANRQIRHDAWAENRHQNQPPPVIPDPAEDNNIQPKVQRVKTFPQGVTVPDAESP